MNFIICSIALANLGGTFDVISYGEGAAGGVVAITQCMNIRLKIGYIQTVNHIPTNMWITHDMCHYGSATGSKSLLTSHQTRSNMNPVGCSFPQPASKCHYHDVTWESGRHTTGNSTTFSHYNDVIMGPMASQITSLTVVYSTVYSGTDQRKHQSSTSLAFVRGIHRSPVKFQHKGPVTRKMFPFADVIMNSLFMLTLKKKLRITRLL